MRRFPPSRAVLFLLAPWSIPATSGGEPFAIAVVDAATGRGVPLIELRTVHEIRLVTDSAGLVAFDEPGLMGREVYFHVRGHGYEFPQDGFGFRGARLEAVPGGSARIEVRRRNVAERLYRATGAGIYRDSVLLGRAAPTRAPLLNGEVLGQDSVQGATFLGKLYWFWGDTNRASYPLGTFGMPGATSELPGAGGLDPEVGVDYAYFSARDGFVAPTADFRGEGPTWLDGLTVLPDPARAGGERMFAAFTKVRPSMEAYRRGIAEFDSATRRFREVGGLPLDGPIRPFGHPFRHEMGGVEYVVFADPFPLVRVRADVEHFLDPARYEAFTCLLPGSTATGEARLDRAEDGRLRYRWRRDAPPLTAEHQERLVRAGALRPDEAMIAVRDVDSGRPVLLSRGSTYYNDHRKRWVMVATELGGTTSVLGEVWYLEADDPLGPWAYARKVVTHDRYSFYNPKQHPAFAKDGGRVIFFEGTYTRAFSGNPDPTPRYDYNQVAYKLDLDDPRLNLPRPVYAVDGRPGFGPRPGESPIFYALDRPAPGGVAVGPFHALPADAADPPGTSVPLREAAGAPGGYSTAGAGSGRVVGRVWEVPTRFAAPG